MKRKAVSVIMAAVLIVSTFAGCTSSKTDGNNTAAGTEQNQEASGTAAEAGSVPKEQESLQKPEPEEISGTVVIWDWDGGTQQKYVDKFNEVYSNVTVEVQDVAWDDYMTKLQTSYVSGMELPDIILGEMAWRGTLFEMNICENLEEAPYNLEPLPYRWYRIRSELSWVCKCRCLLPVLPIKETWPGNIWELTIPRRWEKKSKTGIPFWRPDSR